MAYLKFLIIVFTITVCAAAIGPPAGQHAIDESLDYIQSQTQTFAISVSQLRQTINQINSRDRLSILPVKAALKSCRIQYKKISFFLDYFYPQEGRLFNAPAKTEIEEPYLEVEQPQSLQQIESILFTQNPQLKKKDLQNLILVLDESATGLPSLYAGFGATSAQMLESLHLELIRIMTLYITGYDAPYLKTGILETRAALESMQQMIDVLFNSPKSERSRLDSEIMSAIQYTQTAEFDRFDRLTFLKYYILPIEEQFGQYISSYGSKLNIPPSANHNAGNLFNSETNPGHYESSDASVNIGRALFFDKRLSGNDSRSCATCHQPNKYFSDGLAANRKMDNDSQLRRNTPTLLYASCQSAQFWDGRVHSLSEQITAVLSNPEEMNTSIPNIETQLSQNNQYRKAFHDSVNLEHIEAALTAYLNTLQPRNSTFDRFMAGDEKAMTLQQKKGFNLFMGKAQCGTCHFAPLFNGSIPPYFNRSEYEVIGVPMVTASGMKKADTDLGRYERFPVSEYRRAFKTPTVRNVAKTGPYMHNGSFKSLRAVIDFYNKGGGAGIGLSNPEQTLSERPLHLSHAEVNEVLAFLESLTDNLENLRLGSAKRLPG